MISSFGVNLEEKQFLPRNKTNANSEINKKKQMIMGHLGNNTHNPENFL